MPIGPDGTILPQDEHAWAKRIEKAIDRYLALHYSPDMESVEVRFSWLFFGWWFDTLGIVPRVNRGILQWLKERYEAAGWAFVYAEKPYDYTTITLYKSLDQVPEERVKNPINMKSP